MNIQDRIIEHLNSNDGLVYVYVSSDKDGLNKIRLDTSASVDFSKTTTKAVVLFPVGIQNLHGEVTGGLYFDGDDGKTMEFVQEKVKLAPDAFIKEVDKITKEVNEV